MQLHLIERVASGLEDCLPPPDGYIDVDRISIKRGVPLLLEDRGAITAFHTMIRKKAHADLDPWLERACDEPRGVLRQRRH